MRRAMFFILFVYLAYLFGMVVALYQVKADTVYNEVQTLALNNGFKASNRLTLAIINAGQRYHVNPLELTAIGVLESGLGMYTQAKTNSNGSRDSGIFQINTVNMPKCIEYNLNSIEGNAYCSAKLLSEIRRHHKKDYLGVYHSKTLKHKLLYLNKINKILANK